MNPCFMYTSTDATLSFLHSLNDTQKAAESDLLHCLTDPVVLCICIVYDNLFLLECALPPRIEARPIQNSQYDIDCLRNVQNLSILTGLISCSVQAVVNIVVHHLDHAVP